ncbi:DNA (cytosine-5-)-methyltransferase [uncultured Marinobacter sp.]|uniref:DNA (cytosine-5-)-methyltransferase n=1 Tax=uncultured Marinobacter sp. TaxID=187379 RepID=UPI0030DBAC27|tara:strand:- start:2945 stop:3727 length:783 start_codon:yes stop_codon:yes gene_type:complete
MDVTFLSLFAGIGGIDLGLERAGMRCVGQVEINPFCLQVLQKHWPDVPRWEDVREFPPPGVEIISPDLIAAGFPCQDLSYAQNKPEGLSGERSGLFYEVIRISSVLRPRYILLENVPALLARGMGEVLRNLAEIGYDAEWHCIPVCSLGGPTIRDRVYIIGTLSDSHEQGLEGWDGEVMQERAGQRIIGEGGSLEEFSGRSGGRWWKPRPDLCRTSSGVPRRVDRIKSLGNSVSPPVAQFIGEQIMKAAEEEWLSAHNAV